MHPNKAMQWSIDLNARSSNYNVRPYRVYLVVENVDQKTATIDVCDENGASIKTLYGHIDVDAEMAELRNYCETTKAEQSEKPIVFNECDYNNMKRSEYADATTSNLINSLINTGRPADMTPATKQNVMSEIQLIKAELLSRTGENKLNTKLDGDFLSIKDSPLIGCGYYIFSDHDANLSDVLNINVDSHCIKDHFIINDKKYYYYYKFPQLPVPPVNMDPVRRIRRLLERQRLAQSKEVRTKIHESESYTMLKSLIAMIDRGDFNNQKDD